MITELIPLLTTHTISFKLEITGDDLIVYVMPTVKREKVHPTPKNPSPTSDIKYDISDEDDIAVLEQNLTRRFKLSEFSEVTLTNELLSYKDTMVEGTTQIIEISEALKKRIEEKKKATTTTKRATNGKKKPAPKRKTKAQKEAEEREAARAKQEEERKDEKPPEEEGNRLDLTPEQVVEQARDAQPETPTKPKVEDDPLGLGLGDLDL
ncbi:MAG: hypothetical protein CMC82_01750 [Flavobacteriaceae bacterium]|nr:hypothetical protein [Flavobacteriaceae bacterium]|tara:strand:+ start:366 stop:992 length:627 start_codon:yes stop_codon:yes gene_type:complete